MRLWCTACVAVLVAIVSAEERTRGGSSCVYIHKGLRHSLVAEHERHFESSRSLLILVEGQY